MLRVTSFTLSLMSEVAIKKTSLKEQKKPVGRVFEGDKIWGCF